jgi:hypothetical protein
MPASHSLLAFKANRIKGRPCGKCKATMILVGAEPAQLGFDRRTFGCVRCDHREWVTVETKSKNWLDAGMERSG